MAKEKVYSQCISVEFAEFSSWGSGLYSAQLSHQGFKQPDGQWSLTTEASLPFAAWLTEEGGSSSDVELRFRASSATLFFCFLRGAVHSESFLLFIVTATINPDSQLPWSEPRGSQQGIPESKPLMGWELATPNSCQCQCLNSFFLRMISRKASQALAFNKSCQFYWKMWCSQTQRSLGHWCQILKSHGSTPQATREKKALGTCYSIVLMQQGTRVTISTLEINHET